MGREQRGGGARRRPSLAATRGKLASENLLLRTAMKRAARSRRQRRTTSEAAINVAIVACPVPTSPGRPDGDSSPSIASTGQNSRQSTTAGNPATSSGCGKGAWVCLAVQRPLRDCTRSQRGRQGREGHAQMACRAAYEIGRAGVVQGVDAQAARGEPQDIAGAAVFVASPLAAFITGVVLPVDAISSPDPSLERGLFIVSRPSTCSG